MRQIKISIIVTARMFVSTLSSMVKFSHCNFQRFYQICCIDFHIHHGQTVATQVGEGNSAGEMQRISIKSDVHQLKAANKQPGYRNCSLTPVFAVKIYRVCHHDVAKNVAENVADITRSCNAAEITM